MKPSLSVKWKTHKMPLPVIVGICLLAILGYVLLEVKGTRPMAHPELKVAAATRTALAYAELKHHRADLRIGAIDPENDPLGSGIIGIEDSPITSKHGHLPAKQTTINPNWAGVFIEMFEAAGLHPGDVAVFGGSGSFPALNVAALVAAEVYQLKPIMLSSVMSSQWGANNPAFTWLDMQSDLVGAGLLSTRSAAASIGGRGDRAVGKSAATVSLARAAMLRAGVAEISAESIGGSVSERLAIVRKAAGDAPIRIYVNIGGGEASLGGAKARPFFHPGTNLTPLTAAEAADLPPSLMRTFGDTGIPVVNVTGIKTLAQRYRLPWRPKTLQAPGEGAFYGRRVTSKVGAMALLGLIFVSLAASRVTLRRAAFKGPAMPAVPTMAAGASGAAT